MKKVVLLAETVNRNRVFTEKYRERLRQQFDFVKFKSRIEQFITLAFFGMINFKTIQF